jgi:hypothetical protein
LSNLIDLNSAAKQITFCELVGVSQSAIAQHVKKGRLKSGGTYGEWLLAYTEHIRNEASGRGGDHQASLTAVRIMEMHENIAEKRQRRLAAASDLLDRSMVEAWVGEAAGTIQTLVMGAGDTIVESIAAKYNVEVDSDDVLGPIRTALGHAGKAGSELAERLSNLGGDVSSDASDGDS